VDLSVNNSATPWVSAMVADASKRCSIAKDMGVSRWFPAQKEHLTIREDHSMDECEGTQSASAHKGAGVDPMKREIDTMKRALAQLYLSCSRSRSFGEMLLAKTKAEEDDSIPENFVDSAPTPLCEAGAAAPKSEERRTEDGELASTGKWCSITLTTGASSRSVWSTG